MGMSIGMMLGQNIMALVIGEVGISRAFWFSCFTLTVATLVLVTGVRRVYSTLDCIGMHQKFEDAIGDDPTAFAEKAGSLVTEYLVRHKDKMTNRPIQKLVLTKLLSTVPSLPEWDEKSGGEAYLSALWEECDRYDAVRDEFAQTFRNAGVNVISHAHSAHTGGMSMLEHEINHHLEGADTERRRSKSTARLLASSTVELEDGLARKS